MERRASPARILVVDDDRAVVDYLLEMLEEAGFDADGTTRPNDALERLATESFDMVVADVEMPEMRGIELMRRIHAVRPRMLVILITAFGTIDLAVECLRSGAADFVTKPFDFSVLRLAIERTLDERRMRREIVRLRAALGDEPNAPTPHSDQMVAESAAMNRVLELARRVALADTSVVLLGESGVGKSAVARYIHEHSPRGDGPFVEINCAAVPETLAESELFGVRRGAFTDAREDRPGLFVAANGGTLFLDEVAELDPRVQAKLLQALEHRSVRPVGETTSRAVDVRLIAASNRSLDHAVEREKFREDLLFRLGVITIEIPPLRDRPEDIDVLVDVLLARICRRLNRPIVGVSEDGMRWLRAHPWPGNVRQLGNLLERAVVLAEHDSLLLEDFAGVSASPPDASDVLDKLARRGLSLHDVESAYLDAVLRVTKGNRSEAAKLLGIDRRTLYRRLSDG
ncbi:MAG: sigma-54 dependent transcriptional regulator [Enhygromyxa sp.]